MLGLALVSLLALADPGLKAPHKITLDAPGDTVRGVTWKLKGALATGDSVVIRWLRGATLLRTDKSRSATTFSLPATSVILPPTVGTTDTIQVCVSVSRPTVANSPEACASKVRRNDQVPHPGVEDVQIVPASLTLRSSGVARFCAFLRWSDNVATRSRPFHQDCEAAFQQWRAGFRLRTQAAAA